MQSLGQGHPQEGRDPRKLLEGHLFMHSFIQQIHTDTFCVPAVQGHAGPQGCRLCSSLPSRSSETASISGAV